MGLKRENEKLNKKVFTEQSDKNAVSTTKIVLIGIAFFVLILIFVSSVRNF